MSTKLVETVGSSDRKIVEQLNNLLETDLFASRFADFGQDRSFSASVEGFSSLAELDNDPSSENAKELDATQAFQRKAGRLKNDVVDLLFSQVSGQPHGCKAAVCQLYPESVAGLSLRTVNACPRQRQDLAQHDWVKLVLDVLLRALRQELQSTKREATFARCGRCHVFYYYFLEDCQEHCCMSADRKRRFVLSKERLCRGRRKETCEWCATLPLPDLRRQKRYMQVY